MAKQRQTNGTPNLGRMPLLGNLQGSDLDKFHDIVANALLSRQELMRSFLDPRRDIDDECGYPKITEAVNVEVYRQLYDREAIATRVVQVLPNESWQVTPTVYEDDDTETSTEFEEAWDELGSTLAGGLAVSDDPIIVESNNGQAKAN